MHEPYLALYVDAETLHVVKKLPSESEPRCIVKIPVEQVVGDEFNNASEKLGSTVLGILKLWHKQVFKGWDRCSYGSKSEIDDFAVAMSLIDRFSGGTSKHRLELVDEILKDASITNISTKRFLNDSWPVLRKWINSYSNRQQEDK